MTQDGRLVTYADKDSLRTYAAFLVLFALACVCMIVSDSIPASPRSFGLPVAYWGWFGLVVTGTSFAYAIRHYVNQTPTIVADENGMSIYRPLASRLILEWHEIVRLQLRRGLQSTITIKVSQRAYSRKLSRGVFSIGTWINGALGYGHVSVSIRHVDQPIGAVFSELHDLWERNRS